MRFSTCWQRTARIRGSIATATRAITASIVAASMAADELTPLPSGTSDSTRMAAPAGNVTPCSRASTWKTPATYAAQWRSDRRRTRRARRRTDGADRATTIERHVAAALEPLVSDRGDRDPRARPGADRHAGRLANRPLQHKCARVVRDAAHHVEPAWRAGHEHRPATRSAAARRARRRRSTRDDDVRRESLEVRHILGHGGRQTQAAGSFDQAPAGQRACKVGLDPMR